LGDDACIAIHGQLHEVVFMSQQADLDFAFIGAGQDLLVAVAVLETYDGFVGALD